MSGADEVGKKAAKAAKAVVEDAANLAGDAVDTAGEAVGKGVDAAKGALGAVGGMIGGLGTSLGSKITEAAGDGLDAAKGAADKVAGVVGDVAEGAADLAANAADKVGDVAGDVVDAAKGVLGGAAAGLADVTDGAASMAKAAGDKVSDTGAAALGAGVAAIGGITAMAGNVGTSAFNAVTGGAGAPSDTASGAGSDGGAGGQPPFSGLLARDNDGSDKGPGFLLPLFGVLGLLGLGYVGWYTISKGRPVETAPAAVAAPAAPAVPAWITAIGDALKGQFAWLSVAANGQNVIVSGEAPDAATKDAAFSAAEAAVKAAPEGANSLVIDNIKVVGDASGPVGAALATLGNNPDVAACGKAFTDTMAGRTINFVTGGATISGDNARLLDTLTAVATACKAHQIEIGGHTDSKGKPDSNQALSQKRADAVKAYWTGKGVAAEGLVATGFGETKPVEDVGDETANEKNRRIEFTVSAAGAAPAAAPAPEAK
jgi:outer membrane protein OmpA-like peptidoglycan-associated protein